MKREKVVSILLAASITGILMVSPCKNISAETINNQVQQESILLDFDIKQMNEAVVTETQVTTPETTTTAAPAQVIIPLSNENEKVTSEQKVEETQQVIIPLVNQNTQTTEAEKAPTVEQAPEAEKTAPPIVEIESKVVEEVKEENTQIAETPQVDNVIPQAQQVIIPLVDESVKPDQTQETTNAVIETEKVVAPESEKAAIVTGTTVQGIIQTNENIQEQQQAPKEKKLVFLAPSTQYANLYIGGITNEGVEMNKIMDIIEEKLSKIDTIEIARNNPNKLVNGYIADANELNPDLYFSLHSNAGGGSARGPEVWSYSDVGEAAEFAETVYDNLLEIYPEQSYGRGTKQTTGYAELNSVNAPSIIAEIAFHDNSEDAKWILENEEKIADAMVESILEHLEMHQ